MLTPIQKAHLTIFSQAVAPRHPYFAAGTNFGYIGLFHHNIQSRPELNHIEKPVATWLGHGDSGGSYSLEGTEDFLISGGLGEIVAWRWTDLIQYSSGSSQKRPPQAVWKLVIPRKDSFNLPEVNSLCLKKDGSQLYAGCGDAKVHCFDITTGQLVASIKGHKDFIHSVSAVKENELVTSCEEGTVRLWDLRRSPHEVLFLQPSSCADLARPNLGSWISTAHCDPANPDWLVCGGGPRLAVWHLRAMKHTAVLEPPEEAALWTVQSARFYGDGITACGSQPRLFRWFMTGELTLALHSSSNQMLELCEVPVSGSSNGEACPLLTCGSSKYIDLFDGIGHKRGCFQF